MPHIRIRGVKPEIVQSLSETVHLELAVLMKTPADNFTFELIETRFFSRGQAGGEYPFVEVLWFDRGADTKQAVASHLTASMRTLSGAADIAVVFQAIEPSDYFENGQHF